MENTTTIKWDKNTEAHEMLVEPMMEDAWGTLEKQATDLERLVWEATKAYCLKMFDDVPEITMRDLEIGAACFNDGFHAGYRLNLRKCTS